MALFIGSYLVGGGAHVCSCGLVIKLYTHCDIKKIPRKVRYW